MHALNSRKKRFRFEEDEQRYGYLPEHPQHSHATWVAIAVGGSAVLGAGVSLYGSSQQKKANAAAQDQNIAQQNKLNDSAWTNWLMTRGVAPTGGTGFTAGQMPTAGQSTAVNTRLPLWATLSVPSTVAGRASGGSGRITLTGTARNPNPSPAGAVTGAGDQTGGTTGGKSAGLRMLDPGNLFSGGARTPGNVGRNILDPLGLFG